MIEDIDEDGNGEVSFEGTGKYLTLSESNCNSILFINLLTKDTSYTRRWQKLTLLDISTNTQPFKNLLDILHLQPIDKKRPFRIIFKYSVKIIWLKDMDQKVLLFGIMYSQYHLQCIDDQTFLHLQTIDKKA